MHQIKPEVCALLEELAVAMREADRALMHEIFESQLWRLDPDQIQRKDKNSGCVTQDTISDTAHEVFSKKTAEFPLSRRIIFLDNFEYSLSYLSKISGNFLLYSAIFIYPTTNNLLARLANDRSGEMCPTERRLATVVLAYRLKLNSKDFDSGIPDDCAAEAGGMRSADAIGAILFGAKTEPGADPAEAGRKWRGRLKKQGCNSTFSRSLMESLPNSRGRPRSAR